MQACVSHITESQFYQDLHVQVGFLEKFLNSATELQANQKCQKCSKLTDGCRKFVDSFDSLD